jgi:hypothetical protein
MEIKTGYAILISPNSRIRKVDMFNRKEKPLQYWATLIFQYAANCAIVFTSTDFKELAKFNSEKYVAIGAIIFFLTSFQVFCYYYYNKLKKKD